MFVIICQRTQRKQVRMRGSMVHESKVHVRLRRIGYHSLWDLRFSKKLSHLTDHVKTGSSPYPLLSCVSGFGTLDPAQLRAGMLYQKGRIIKYVYTEFETSSSLPDLLPLSPYQPALYSQANRMSRLWQN